MAKVILGTTMSLDGYINDRSGSGAALYPDLSSPQYREALRELIQNTGAVVMGRNSYAMAEDPDFFADSYEFQVPIFVVTHQAPKRHPKENEALTITFVTDGMESAVTQAKTAAGGKDVTIIGAASTAQQVLKAGLADELQVDIMPVLLCGGLRFFGDVCPEPIQLERLRVIEEPGGRTHLSFRILPGRI